MRGDRDDVAYTLTNPFRMAYSMAWLRSQTYSFERMWLIWFLTVFSLRTNRLTISLLGTPAAISLSTSISQVSDCPRRGLLAGGGRPIMDKESSLPMLEASSLC